MPLIYRSLLVSFAAVSAAGPAWAEDEKPVPKQAEYKRSDTNFYPRGDVLKNHSASVILTKGNYTQTGDSYFFTPKAKAPKEIYIEIDNDWVEPITPPDMPASLNIAPDAMQIREPQGDVTVALPSAPGSFATVTDGMAIPNGAVVKTGPNATAAILLGGVDSARLMPNSEAAVQQTVTATTRTAEVDLTSGGVFSKVGKQVGVMGDYEVHTPSGNAIAHGTDFVTLIAQGHTDVWIAQGTVELVPVNEKKGDSATGDGTGPLKLLRYPTLTDPKEALAADIDGLTAILNFIPMADQKVAALRAQLARGTTLTTNQQDYLGRIKQVPAFIKLALVEPPAPPPVAVAPVPPKPETITVHPNGTIKFQDATMGLAEFQDKLKALIATNPDQAVVIKAGPKVPYAKFKDVLDSCQAAQVKTVTVAEAPTQPAPPSTTPTAETPPVAPPPAPVPIVPPPLIGVDNDGKLYLDSAAASEDDLKSKLSAVAAGNPKAELILVKRTKVTTAQWQHIVDLCHDAKLKVHVLNEKEYKGTVTAMPPEPPPAPAPAPVPPPLLGLDNDGKLFADGAPASVDDLKTKLTTVAATNPKAEVTLVKRAKVTKAQWQPIVDLCHDSKLKIHVIDEKEYKGTVAAMPPEPPPAPAPPPVPPPLLGLDNDGKLYADGAVASVDDLKTKLANVATTNPKAEVTLVKRAKVTKAQWQPIVDLCHDAKLKIHVIDEKEYKGTVTVMPPEPPPAPAPPPVSPPLLGLDNDGKLFADGAPASVDDLKTKLADVATTNPKAEVTLVKRAKVTAKAQWLPIVDLCHDAKLKIHVIDEKEYKGTVTVMPPEPPPAPAPPPVPPPVLAIDNDGKLYADGASESEDDLKTKLATVATTNPKAEVILVKRAKVTKAQWQPIVDLCHDAKLKVHVLNEKEYKGTTAVLPPEPAPTAETPVPPSMPTPATAPTAIEAAPSAVIGLDADGQTSFNGEPATEGELKAKLDALAKTNPDQPLLLLKLDRVTRDQWEHVAALCHEAKLKVRVVSAKDYVSTPSTPAAPAPTTPTAESPTPTAETPEMPTPHLAATPAPQKLVPVEIDLSNDGKLTLDGTTVTTDDLKTKLGDIAKANPQQSLLFVKGDKSSHSQINQVIALCHEAKLKVHVKTAKTFTPTTPAATSTTPQETFSTTPNLPAPSVHMHPVIEPATGDASTPSPPATNAPPPAGP